MLPGFEFGDMGEHLLSFCNVPSNVSWSENVKVIISLLGAGVEWSSSNNSISHDVNIKLWSYGIF